MKDASLTKLHLALLEAGQYTDAKLDGTDSPMYGPGLPKGMTVAIRPNGEYELLTTKAEGTLL